MLDFFSRLAMSLLYNLKQFTIMCPDTQNVYKFTFILLLFYFIFSFKMKNWWQLWNGGLKWSSATTIFWSRDFRFPDLRENFSLHRSKFKKKLRKNFWIGLLSIFFLFAQSVSVSPAADVCCCCYGGCLVLVTFVVDSPVKFGRKWRSLGD